MTLPFGLAFAVIGMTGCVREIVMSDGTRAYARSCGERAQCYAYMGRICPTGYTVVEESCIGPRAVGSTPQVNVNVNGTQTPSTGTIACSKLTLIFRCRDNYTR